VQRLETNFRFCKPDGLCASNYVLNMYHVSGGLLYFE
jgi:hypothetical protein